MIIFILTITAIAIYSPCEGKVNIQASKDFLPMMESLIPAEQERVKEFYPDATDKALLTRAQAELALRYKEIRKDNPDISTESIKEALIKSINVLLTEKLQDEQICNIAKVTFLKKEELRVICAARLPLEIDKIINAFPDIKHDDAKRQAKLRLVNKVCLLIHSCALLSQIKREFDISDEPVVIREITDIDRCRINHYFRNGSRNNTRNKLNEVIAKFMLAFPEAELLADADADAGTRTRRIGVSI